MLKNPPVIQETQVWSLSREDPLEKGMATRLIGKELDAGKNWRQNEKRAAEDEMVREHHQLNGH